MPNHTRSGESGFALILALLALMLLTTLGITLATTTSTEMQIATNFRWGLQAKYNAEAGLELGKRFLRQTDWRAILPQGRGVADFDAAEARADNDKCEDPANPKQGCLSYVDNVSSRTGPEGEPSRNYELETCDTWNYAGLGVVLDDLNQAFPFQNSSTMLGATLNGTFTLWIRRPVVFDENGQRVDSSDDSRIVLTAEGTAPYQQGGATGTFQVRNRAVRYMQVELLRTDPTDCENRSSQVGSGPSGANFDNCDAISGEGVGLGLGDPGRTNEAEPDSGVL